MPDMDFYFFRFDLAFCLYFPCFCAEIGAEIMNCVLHRNDIRVSGSSFN